MEVIRKINNFKVLNDSEYRLDYVLRNLAQLLELKKILAYAKEKSIKIEINRSGYFSNIYFDLSSYDNGIEITIQEKEEEENIEDLVAKYIEKKKDALGKMTNIREVIVKQGELESEVLNLLNKYFDIIFEDKQK